MIYLLKDSKLNADDLSKFCRLVGSPADEEDIRNLRLRCTALADQSGELKDKLLEDTDLENAFTFYRIMEAIESFSVDTSLNPAVVTRTVLSKTFSGGDSLSIRDLGNFLRNFKTFTKEEVSLILGEIRYLQSISMIPDSDDVALLLRDLCERQIK